MKRIITIFLAMLAGICFGVALSTHLLVTGALGKAYRAYIVQSGSMAPTLPVGSVVITKQEKHYGKGDIVTFAQGSSQVTHRIDSVSFNGTEAVYVTKGDANEEADSAPIRKDQIIGKSFLVVPFVGYFADFLRTPKGFVLFVVIPASIIIYEELKAVLKELKRVLFKKGEQNGTSAKAALFLPIIGIALMFLSATGSFFQDHEKSGANVLGAAANFRSPTPAPTLTPSPSPSPSPTPSVNPSPSPTPTPLTNLKINEFLPIPSPASGPDWIEIYNPTLSEVNLDNWELRDTTGNMKTLAGSISAGGFRVFDVSNRLNNSGDTIFLLDSNGVTIDQYQYPPPSTTPNVSIGRQTDGSGAFQTCASSSRGTTNNGICQP